MWESARGERIGVGAADIQGGGVNENLYFGPKSRWRKYGEKQPAGAYAIHKTVLAIPQLRALDTAVYQRLALCKPECRSVSCTTAHLSNSSTVNLQSVPE